MSSVDGMPFYPDHSDNGFSHEEYKYPPLPRLCISDENQEGLTFSDSKKGGYVFKSIVRAFQNLGKEEHLGRAIGKGMALTTGSLIFGLSCILSVGLPVAGAVLGVIFGAGVGGVVGLFVGSAAGVVSGLALGAVSAGLFKLGGVEEDYLDIYKTTAMPASASAVPLVIGGVVAGSAIAMGVAALVVVFSVVPITITRIVSR